MSESAVVRAAVLGSPISHSKSPQLHAAAYRYLGLEADYTRIELTEAEAACFLGEAAGFTGFSVTMPLKAVMVDHMTAVSDRVATLGVLNTITVEDAEAGPAALFGENTDVCGITAALRGAGLGQADGSSFAVIGAGGTAAAALAAAADLGFSSVKVYARSPARGAAAVPLARRLGLEAEIRYMDQLPADIAGFGLGALVSTLPPKAADALAAELESVQWVPPLLDVAYDPWPSALATRWEATGGPVASGLEMLLHQAVRQVELFTASTARPAAALNLTDHAQMVAQMRAAVEL